MVKKKLSPGIRKEVLKVRKSSQTQKLRDHVTEKNYVLNL